MKRMWQLVCEQNKCTACGACRNVCSKACISFKESEYDVKSAYIDTELCIECNQCRMVCPVINNLPGNQSIDCYAAWSLRNEVRTKSASGGIATELYRYAVDNGYWIAGVEINSAGLAYYSLKKDDYIEYQNSKYTFSDMREIYLLILSKLLQNEKVLFIGLPCHIAAVKSFLRIKKITDAYIVFVDLICHGVTPEKYLAEHIKRIENTKKKKNTKISFRDPRYGTYKYFFSLTNNDDVFYKKSVTQDDEFQIAYHSGIAYRENCYTCQYANCERMGDMTLSDFIGLGSVEKRNYSDKNVSCVMINTDKGKKIYSELTTNEYIFSDRRPIDENFRFQPTMKAATPVPKERAEFLLAYKKSRDFDYAIRIAAKDIIKKNRLNSLTHYRDIKKFCLSLIPRSLKDRLKDILRKKA